MQQVIDLTHDLTIIWSLASFTCMVWHVNAHPYLDNQQ